MLDLGERRDRALEHAAIFFAQAERRVLRDGLQAADERGEISRPRAPHARAELRFGALKLVGRKGPEIDSDATQTLLVRTGRGKSPEEAQRNAISQLTLVYGSPVDPPPSATISNKRTDPPPPPEPEPDPDPEPPKRP